MRIRSVIPIFLLIFSLAWANAVIVEWKAEPAQGKIYLRWKTSLEDNVQKFIIQRSLDNRSFTQIGEITAKGAGSDYEFIDSNLGKTSTVYYYRLGIYHNNGLIQYNDALPVIPNISSISQTWGSIKALFR